MLTQNKCYVQPSKCFISSKHISNVKVLKSKTQVVVTHSQITLEAVMSLLFFLGQNSVSCFLSIIGTALWILSGSLSSTGASSLCSISSLPCSSFCRCSISLSSLATVLSLT